MANVLVDVEPLRGLSLVERAAPLIPSSDLLLRWHAESIRAECHLELKEIGEALRVFHTAQALREALARPRMNLRAKFDAARLLEVLGYLVEAERLFRETVEGDFEQRLYKDCFLDLLYVFGFHLRAGSPERAVEVCQSVLKQLAMLDLVHEQLSEVWVRLIQAAQEGVLSSRLLLEVRDYLRAHWRSPAPATPGFLKRLAAPSQSRGKL